MSLERQLIDDLDSLGDRLVDERFCSDLYRALARNRWVREGDDVSLSFSRAEELLNELRARRDEPALDLAQTGGEGEVAQAVLDEVGRLGWSLAALDTREHEPEHLASAHEPPPKGTGEAQSPADDSGGWAREGHREASEAQRERTGPPRRDIPR